VELTSLYREPERQEELSFGAIEFHDVFKIYRSGPAKSVALRGLNLSVDERELVALFGPSGSGKSTALNLAAGLDEPSAGDVLAFGRSLPRFSETELTAYRAHEVAIVFQSANLWPDLSARDNLVVTVRLAGRRNGVRQAVERALDAFDLQPRAGQRAGSLSGGEQQRLAIAAAAAREARLVLADEPTAELDVRSEQTVLRAFKRLRAEFGSTILVVTHSPRVADVVDRVVEMRDGAVV
jgi:putative ABC transport system ATP-binding protein